MPSTSATHAHEYHSCSHSHQLGYGDIVPVSRVARMLARMEAITGLFYMAVLISRLVSVYSSAQPAESTLPQVNP